MTPNAAPDQRNDPPTEKDLAQLARRVSSFRRKRDAAFGPTIFADPEWDILLDLFAESGTGRRVSMSSLCIAAAVPTTTAVRCINAMVDRGLLVKSRDATDARRMLIDLTEEARETMRGLMQQLARSPLTR